MLTAERKSSVQKLGARADYGFAIAAALLTLYAAVDLNAAMHQSDPDITTFYLKWLAHIVSHGRLASLEGSYANYSPPYLYILSFVSLLSGRLSPVVLIKLAQLPGLLLGAWTFWSLCRKLGCSQRRSLLGAWLLLVSPEVFQNTAVWGQCDMLHTACLLVMLRLLLAKRPGWAMFVFGVAFAFKMQALFAGAAVAALLLSGEAPLWTALLAPVGYVVMMVPARLAGRAWRNLLLIYSHQADAQPDLAKDVANPYQLIYHFSERHLHLVYPAALYGGFLLTLAVMVWLIVFLVRAPWRLRGQHLVLSMAAPLLLAPYLLPKMHDRYFFAGDMLVLLLAMTRPNLWVPAAMLQLSALIVAYPHLYADSKDEPTPFFIVPVLLTTAGLAWIMKLLINKNVYPTAS